MTVYLMCGLPGAGKSTYIKENFSDKVIISKDTIRCILGIGGSSLEYDKKISGNILEEKKVSEIINQQLIECCKNNIDCVIEDINLTKNYRKQYLEKVKPYNPNVVIIYIDTPSDVCAERRKNELSIKIVKKLKFIYPDLDEYNKFKIIKSKY